jgi:plastocyanin
MKKLILLAGAVALLAAAPAPAKTVTVDLSQVGLVPAAVTVQTGDTVIWTNKDTVNHQVVCTKCPFTSPVLAPGQNFPFAFTKAGKFTVVDPLNKNKKGTVTVNQAAATLTLSSSPRAMTYGGTTTLSGTLSTGQVGEKVDVLAQPCGENASKVVATVTTAAGGAFTYKAVPTLTTTYQVRYKPPSGAPVTSAGGAVSIRPVVTLKRTARFRFKASVVSAQSFVGKAVVIQRYKPLSRRWLRVKTVFLGTRTAASTPLTGSTMSSVAFKLRLRSGLKLRAILPSGQAGPCYVAAKSATIRS